MSINIETVPKFVINLSNRKDRLKHITKEFEYMGWSFERFDAIDTSSYIGCAESHIAIAKLAKEKKYPYIMVFEDDIFFMPYAKKLLSECIDKLNNIKWDLFHFAPSIHRTLTYKGGTLVNLSGPHPPKNEKNRGIFGTSALFYSSKMYDEIPKWTHRDGKKWSNPGLHKPIDVFFDEYIYSNFKSYCPNAPIVTQIMDHSTVNNGVWNNHYIMTYNWLSYINKDVPSTFNFDIDMCRKFRDAGK